MRRRPEVGRRARRRRARGGCCDCGITAQRADAHLEHERKELLLPHLAAGEAGHREGEVLAQGEVVELCGGEQEGGTSGRSAADVSTQETRRWAASGGSGKKQAPRRSGVAISEGYQAVLRSLLIRRRIGNALLRPAASTRLPRSTPGSARPHLARRRAVREDAGAEREHPGAGENLYHDGGLLRERRAAGGRGPERVREREVT